MGQAGVGGQGGPRALSGDSMHADEDWASPVQLTAPYQGAALCLPACWGSFRDPGENVDVLGELPPMGTFF